ncbi:PapD-like protein [Pseudocohnilembus persalinus]|uniref:PapD-like protein n=1 Tax=Pseudocohnilembus persalinus TaxID=266149 RepID=A0A0V0QQ66_PSEPJ|nr:PapD-like protein [Pseudocohnilembus persalinus]|eukprot:KRX04247.1 PapD-like protein [Pseudocohnilembus persalinus]
MKQSQQYNKFAIIKPNQQEGSNLQIKFLPDQQVFFGYIDIQNLLNKTLAFKIRTTNPKTTNSKPNQGFIPPLETIKLEIGISASNIQNETKSLKDKFEISIIQIENNYNQDVSMIFKNKSQNSIVQKKQISLSILSMNQEPSDIQQNKKISNQETLIQSLEQNFNDLIQQNNQKEVLKTESNQTENDAQVQNEGQIFLSQKDRENQDQNKYSHIKQQQDCLNLSNSSKKNSLQINDNKKQTLNSNIDEINDKQKQQLFQEQQQKILEEDSLKYQRQYEQIKIQMNYVRTQISHEEKTVKQLRGQKNENHQFYQQLLADADKIDIGRKITLFEVAISCILALFLGAFLNRFFYKQ